MRRFALGIIRSKSHVWGQINGVSHILRYPHASPVQFNRVFSSTRSILPPRVRSMLEDEIFQLLKKVHDPLISKTQNIADLNYVKIVEVDEVSRSATIVLGIPSPIWPSQDQITKDIEKLVHDHLLSARTPKELRGLQSVSVNFTTAHRKKRSGKSLDPSDGKGLKNVHHIIAVSSCKGGVGKSTIAVNLAATMSKMGARVGLLDADIYGPSLPFLISPEDTGVYKLDDGTINPVMYENIATMSYGFVSPRNANGERGGAVLRGPMVSTIVQQLAKLTDWGEVDYLIVDMPPGTGDINITLAQHLRFDGAVVVTTPHTLSWRDVLKGMDMFDKTNVPIVTIVENMAYFDGDDGKRYFPFGRTNEKRLDEDGIDKKRIVSLPIVAQVADSGNEAVPAVLSHPKSGVSDDFRTMATKIVIQLAQNTLSAARVITTVSYKPPKLAIQELSRTGASLKFVSPLTVRLHCKCAQCIDEYSGRQLVDRSTVPEDVHPLEITPQGNYGVNIKWSDGHNSSIYTYAQLRTIAAES